MQSEPVMRAFLGNKSRKKVGCSDRRKSQGVAICHHALDFPFQVELWPSQNAKCEQECQERQDCRMYNIGVLERTENKNLGGQSSHHNADSLDALKVCSPLNAGAPSWECNSRSLNFILCRLGRIITSSFIIKGGDTWNCACLATGKHLVTVRTLLLWGRGPD